MTKSSNTSSDTEPAMTIAEQMDVLKQNVRELRDEILLKPVAAALRSVGVETGDIDETGEGFSLVRSAGYALAGPVLASKGFLLGFYLGIRITKSPDVAAVAGIASGLLFGAAGLLVGFRYLRAETEHTGGRDD